MASVLVAIPQPFNGFSEAPSSLLKWNNFDERSLSMNAQNTLVTPTSELDSWHVPFLGINGVGSLQNLFSGKMNIQLAILDNGLNNHEDLSKCSITWLVDFTVQAQVPRQSRDCRDVGRVAPDNDNGHGTKVTGLVNAAINGQGVMGAAPNVELYIFKIARDCYEFSTNCDPIREDEVAKAIRWAVDGPDGIPGTPDDAEVISMSFEASPTASLIASIEYAASWGVILVAAAGNNGDAVNPNVVFPASHPAVIAVGSINKFKQRSTFSAYGNDLDFVMPGEDLITTYGTTYYVLESGTSFAAPLLSALIALILLKDAVLHGGTRTLTRDGVYNLLKKSALLYGDLYTRGWDAETGYGYLVFTRTLELLEGTGSNPPAPPPPPPPIGMY